MNKYEDLNKKIVECLKHFVPSRYSFLVFTLKKSPIFWCPKHVVFEGFVLYIWSGIFNSKTTICNFLFLLWFFYGEYGS